MNSSSWRARFRPRKKWVLFCVRQEPDCSYNVFLYAYCMGPDSLSLSTKQPRYIIIGHTCTSMTKHVQFLCFYAALSVNPYVRRWGFLCWALSWALSWALFCCVFLLTNCVLLDHITAQQSAVILNFFEKMVKNNADMDVTYKFNTYLEKAFFCFFIHSVRI